MTYLLDANLLIALLDRHHVHHAAAHRWAGGHSKPIRWATCPLVENAFIRITGNPAYVNSFGSAKAALAELQTSCSVPAHTFWPDDISLRDQTLWSAEFFIGSPTSRIFTFWRWPSSMAASSPHLTGAFRRTSCAAAARPFIY